MKIMADEKSILDGGLLEINPNAGFDDLMKAWPKESLYWKEEPPLSPESLAIVEDEYRKAVIRGRGFGKEKAQERLRKQPYVPPEQPLTPVDGLAKILDEIDNNTNL